MHALTRLFPPSPSATAVAPAATLTPAAATPPQRLLVDWSATGPVYALPPRGPPGVVYVTHRQDGTLRRDDNSSPSTLWCPVPLPEPIIQLASMRRNHSCHWPLFLGETGRLYMCREHDPTAGRVTLGPATASPVPVFSPAYPQPAPFLELLICNDEEVRGVALCTRGTVWCLTWHRALTMPAHGGSYPELLADCRRRGMLSCATVVGAPGTLLPQPMIALLAADKSEVAVLDRHYGLHTLRLTDLSSARTRWLSYHPRQVILREHGPWLQKPSGRWDTAVPYSLAVASPATQVITVVPGFTILLQPDGRFLVNGAHQRLRAPDGTLVDGLLEPALTAVTVYALEDRTEFFVLTASGRIVHLWLLMRTIGHGMILGAYKGPPST